MERYRQLAAKSRQFFLYGKSRTCKDDGGSVLVEFALSACMLLLLEIGLFHLCIAIYSYSFISDAAREATRYAMVRGLSLSNDCTQPGYADCIAQNSDIQSYIRGLALPGINPDNVNATTTWLTSSGAACGTADSCKAPGNLVKVTVSYTYPYLNPFSSTSTLNMSSQSQVVIVQ
ncbi:MAG TPA: TadE/TadG family type IV pilus assembly protein [Terracidiphilus sp.]|nr:TadE/TadG family type IV pilus assembly protein [Terracidiphilus sp.]